MLPHSPHPALPQPSRHSPILSSCSRECLSDLSRSCTSRAAGDRYCSEARRAGGGRPGGAALCCLQEPKEALLSCVCGGGGSWKVRAHHGANVPSCVHSEALPGSGVQLLPSDGVGFGAGRGGSEACVVSGQVVSCRHCLHVNSHPGAGTSVLGILWSLAKGHLGDTHPQMLWLPGQSLSSSPKADLQRKPQVQATGGDVGWEAGSGTHLRG